MAKVPVYDDITVNQTVSPPSRFTSPISPEAASIPGQQTENFGKAISSGVHDLATIYADKLKEANTLRVDDSENKVKEKALDLMYNKDYGFMNQKGLSAIERDSGKPLTDEYSEKLQDHINEISSSLSNDAQRQAFNTKAGNVMALYKANALRHESVEYQTYALSVREGTIKTSLDVIGKNYNDPGLVDQEVETIKRNAADAGRINGKSATWVEANTKSLLSNAHTLAIGAAIEKDDIVGATRYLNRYAKQMEADDLLKVRSQIGKQIDTGEAIGSVDKAMTSVLSSSPNSDSNRAWGIAIHTESKGKQFDDAGLPLTSNKGAIGIAQVMPETGKQMAKELGIAWDENKFKNDAAYNTQLGKAYFDKNLKLFEGNLAQTYAAYNAGTQAVLDYRDGTNVSGKNPKKITTPDGIPPFKETLAYVKENVAKYEAGKVASPEPTLKDVLTQVRKNLTGEDGNLRVSDAVLRQAEDSATIRFNNYVNSTKAKNDESYAVAIQSLVNNKGSYDSLPANLKANIPPDKLASVMDFGKRIAAGQDQTKNDVYLQLTDDKYLNSLSDAQFMGKRADLSADDFKRFADKRASVRTGKALTASQDVPSGAIKQSLDMRLRSIGIDPTPKESDKNEMIRVGSIHKYVNDAVLEEQAAIGRKLTDVEVDKKIDSLFAKSLSFRNTFLGISGGLQTKPILGLDIGEIKKLYPDLIKQIEADYKLKNRTPTDFDILNTFHKLRMKVNG